MFTRSSIRGRQRSDPAGQYHRGVVRSGNHPAGLAGDALVTSRALGRFSLRDIQIAAGLLTPVATDQAAESPTQAKIDGAFQEVGLEDVQATAMAVADAIARTEGIEARLTDLMA